MNLDTSFWHWPQWAILTWFCLTVLVQIVDYGKPFHKPVVRRTGDVVSIIMFRWALFLFILVCGGFFR